MIRRPWRSVTGPVYGSMTLQAPLLPEEQELVHAATDAGVLWLPGDRNAEADFRLARSASADDRFEAFARATSHTIHTDDFAQVLQQHRSTGTGVRDLLWARFFAQPRPLERGAVYLVRLARVGFPESGAIVRVTGASGHVQSGNLFIESELSDSGDPLEFPVSAVEGGMKHLGSGEIVTAHEVASALLPPAEGERRSGNTVTIAGDVGQSVAGDASFSGPVTFGRSKK